MLFIQNVECASAGTSAAEAFGVIVGAFIMITTLAVVSWAMGRPDRSQ